MPNAISPSFLPRIAAIVLSASIVSGCSIGYRPYSPEETYRPDAALARGLQVPPDLRGIGQGEQYVLPGTSGAAVKRDTLLPVFESVQVQRSGNQVWIELAASAEDVWPQVLGFARQESYRISRTEPVNGLVISEWQSLSQTSDGGLSLANLLPGSPRGDYQQRILFRLERGTSNSANSRLFVTVQLAANTDEAVTGALNNLWPEKTDSDIQAVVTQRLLVYLGIEEQKAKGMLSASAATAVREPAALEVTPAGSHLVIYQGVNGAAGTLQAALDTLGLETVSFDRNNGTLLVHDNRALFSQTPSQIMFKISPVHVSAVKVSYHNAQGEIQTGASATRVLHRIRQSIV